LAERTQFDPQRRSYLREGLLFCQNKPNCVVGFLPTLFDYGGEEIGRCVETSDNPVGAPAMEANAEMLPTWKARFRFALQ
jgi:hypothetical protein